MWLILLVLLNTNIKNVIKVFPGRMIINKVKVTLIIPGKAMPLTENKMDVSEKSPEFDITYIYWYKDMVKMRIIFKGRNFPVSSRIYFRGDDGKCQPVSSDFTFVPQSQSLFCSIPYRYKGKASIILMIRGNGAEINILKKE